MDQNEDMKMNRMQKPTARWTVRAGILLAATAALTVGCGKADYEKAMNARISGLAFESKFIESLQRDPTEVVTDVASLRLPVYIDDRAQSLTVGKRDRQRVPIDPRRIQPPGMKIPGFKYSYEKFIDLGGRNNTNPVYVYFGSVPASQNLNAVLGPLQKGVKKISRNASFTDVTLDTPDRTKLAFKKITATGVQDFEVDESGGSIDKIAGQIEFYVHSTKDHHVIVGFRGTDEAASKVNMFDTAPFVVGTLEVEAAAPEDGEDL